IYILIHWKSTLFQYSPFGETSFYCLDFIGVCGRVLYSPDDRHRWQRPMNTQYLIQDKTERYQRNADNMQCVIQFLIQETYSTITNLMVLLNYQKRQPLDRLLAKLKG
ncbi:hypothetical protein P3718_26745, partial [Vibrio parahaemolyticus]|nr:hypothetical protein [Vibrio parahaemolyticus]